MIYFICIDFLGYVIDESMYTANTLRGLFNNRLPGWKLQWEQQSSKFKPDEWDATSH